MRIRGLRPMLRQQLSRYPYLNMLEQFYQAKNALNPDKPVLAFMSVAFRFRSIETLPINPLH